MGHLSEAHYERRLQTFTYWPKEDPPSRVALARAGFRYLNSGDKVQCDTCKVRLHNFRIGDDPFDEHQKYSPNCSFLAKLEEEENISSGSESEDQKLEKEGQVYMSGTGTWVQNQLERSIVKILLDRKFDLGLIREAISARYQEKKQEFPDAGQLFKAVYKLREEKEKQKIEEEKRQSSVATDRRCKGESDLSSCVICEDEPRGAVFVPCGHLATCTGCATRLTDCPICRQGIQMRVRVYIA